MVRLRIIYNGHNACLMHNPVCHCNHLYTDYNSRPSKLVSTSVTLASFIQPRAVVCVTCAHTEFLSHRSVCITHDENRISPPTHRIRREVALLFFIGYIFFYIT